ncbi:unnamed protein product, partial [Ectocarpus sp. 12 AP-2014]
DDLRWRRSNVGAFELRSNDWRLSHGRCTWRGELDRILACCFTRYYLVVMVFCVELSTLLLAAGVILVTPNDDRFGGGECNPRPFDLHVDLGGRLIHISKP